MLHSYAGSLTFSLSSGLKITIPNSQLVVPDLSINNQGTTIANGSTREIMLNSLQGINANDMPILGQAFLTSAYLMVNQDAGTFTLWQSQATLNQSLVGIGPSKTCAAPTTTSATVTNLVSSTSSSAPHPNPPGPSLLSGGATAGTCIGAVVFCALVLGVILWLRRRSRHRKQMSRADGPPFSEMSVLDMPELPYDNHKPQELPWRSTMQEAPQRYPNEMAA